MNRYPLMLIIGAVLVLALTGCAEQTATQENPPSPEGAVEQQTQIVIVSQQYEPSELTVPPGTTITWVNQSDDTHTVTAGVRDNPSGLFDSGDLALNDSFQFTFDTPGVYEFFCRHHEGMRGTITVTEA